MKYIVFILLLSLFIFCGKNTNNECVYAAAPTSLFFTIKQNGKIYPDSVLNSFKVSYYKNGTKNYVLYYGKVGGEYKDSGLLAVQNIDVIATGDPIVNKFYVEYGYNFPSDSFFVDYAKPSKETNCVYKLKTIYFNNGNAVKIDTVLSSKLFSTVYIFNK